jgi:CheY-like chemotaxis protein
MLQRIPYPVTHREPAKPLTPARPYRVLLAEDDAEMRDMLHQVLTKDGFDVITAADGSEALEIVGEMILQPEAHRRVLDLLISDQRMPGFEGLRVIEALRLARFRVPAILITAFGDRAIVRDAIALGGTVVLDKPFELRNLLSMSRRLVGCNPRSRTPLTTDLWEL